MFLSIDIGGTKTLLALFSFHGFLLKTLRFPTEKDPAHFLKTLETSLSSFLNSEKQKSRLKAVTVAVPGTIKLEQNFCSISCENLKWSNFDLLTPLKNLFSCKIFFANDANLATLYESSRLHSKSQKIIYLTFSTGIGGGISENGHLSKSSDTFEPGHKIYSYDNKNQEWEDIASAKTLSEVYNSPLKTLKLTPETETDLISRLLPGLTDILNSELPNTLIIGGPLGYLINKIKRPLLDRLKESLESSPKIIKAHYPEKSVIYGAYLYSKQNYKK